MTGPLEAQWGGPSTWSIGWWLARQAEVLGAAPFVEVDGVQRSFAQTYAAAQVAAAALSRQGVGRGDHVVIMSPTGTDFIDSWLGAGLLGAIDVPLNDAYRGPTLVHALNLAAAKVLVMHADYLPRLREVVDELTALRTVLVAGERPEASEPIGRLAVLPLELGQDAAAGGVLTDPVTQATAYRELATVLLTSGTTGPAKGVLMTNAQTYAIARECLEGLRLTGRDVFYCFHPMFHMAGKFGAFFACLVAGSRLVLDRAFDADRWLERVRESGATVSIAHGPMIELIHATPRRPDDDANPMRVVLAAPLPAAIGAEFEQRFGLRALETWGMTEVTACCWRPYDAPLRLGSAGRPRDDLVEIAVVDPDTDEVLPPGQVGEITVRPRQPWLVMQGYLGMPDKTVEAWRNFRFHSGDAGYFDEDGWLYFVDRAGDRIRRKAENISSYDIEVAAAAYRGVREVAAVGVPSDHHDDEIKLCVVIDHDVELPQLFSHLVMTLPHYMVPRYIDVLNRLPRTPTNKIRKRELRQDGVTSTAWDYRTAGLSIRSIRTAHEGAAGREGTTE